MQLRKTIKVPKYQSPVKIFSFILTLLQSSINCPIVDVMLEYDKTLYYIQSSHSDKVGNKI